MQDAEATPGAENRTTDMPTTGVATGATLDRAASKRKNGFFKPFFDGTLYDTLFYRDPGEERFGPLVKAYNGFSELLQRETRTRRVNSYQEILGHDETWAHLDEKMNAYFDDAIEMFPYERRKSYVDANGRKVTDARIINPDNYFKIRIETLQRRFPGGNDGKIGDQDVRDLTSCMRVLYKNDLWSLIVKRRFSAVVALAVILGCLLGTALLMPLLSHGQVFDVAGVPVSLGGLGLGAATVVACIAAIFGNRMYLRDLSVRYESALKTSASNLRNALHPRLTESVSLIAQIMSQIDREKMELKSQDRLKEWPVVVTRWTKLAFWLSARVEALEDFIQIQMWLARRTHFGLRRIAGLISVAIFAAFVFVLAVVTGVGGLSLNGFLSEQLLSSITELGVLALVVLLTGIVIVLNAQDYDIPVISLQEILQMHTIMGHKDTKLHDEIANLIKREKLSILHDEEMFKGPKPR